MGAPTELEVDGRFERGLIVLDNPPAWPEGMRVHLRVTLDSAPSDPDQERWERFMALAGSVPDLECPRRLAAEASEPLE